MTEAKTALSIDDILNAEMDAEGKIREILLNLEGETGRRVDWVRIDTRNFAECNVEVCLTRASGE